MEEVVNVREAEPQGEHQGLAVLVIALTYGGEVSVGGLPKAVWKGEGFEAV
jgi:hypothetical protein